MIVCSFDVGMKNMAFCIFNTDTSSIEYWETFEVTLKHNDIYHAVIDSLETYESYFELCDTFLIEKQPSKNNKMRIIEALLNAYFIIKHKNAKVIIYSAKHKLGYNTFKGKDNYRERKKLSVARTSCFIKTQNDYFQKQFQESKKKDDLADSLLQLLSYINHNDYIEMSNTVLTCTTTIIPRKPTKNQLKKMFSKSNLKHFYLNSNNITDDIKLKMLKAINYWYKKENFDESLKTSLNEMKILDFKFPF